MFTDDQIKQLRQVIREDVHAEVKPLETAVNQIQTTLDAVTAGGQTLATKADVQDMMAELKTHKRRIENLEEETKTPNPYKH